MLKFRRGQVAWRRRPPSSACFADVFVPARPPKMQLEQHCRHHSLASQARCKWCSAGSLAKRWIMSSSHVERVCRLLAGRAAQGEAPVAVPELHALCQQVALIAQAALGLQPSCPSGCDGQDATAARGALSHDALRRWGLPSNLFAARLNQDGSSYLQRTVAPAVGGSRMQPMCQPEVRFVQDWPVQDSQWRHLDASMLWPSMQHTVACMGAGALAALASLYEATHWDVNACLNMVAA